MVSGLPSSQDKLAFRRLNRIGLALNHIWRPGQRASSVAVDLHHLTNLPADNCRLVRLLPSVSKAWKGFKNVQKDDHKDASDHSTKMLAMLVMGMRNASLAESQQPCFTTSSTITIGRSSLQLILPPKPLHFALKASTQKIGLYGQRRWRTTCHRHPLCTGQKRASSLRYLDVVVLLLFFVLPHTHTPSGCRRGSFFSYLTFYYYDQLSIRSFKSLTHQSLHSFTMQGAVFLALAAAASALPATLHQLERRDDIITDSNLFICPGDAPLGGCSLNGNPYYVNQGIHAPDHYWASIALQKMRD